MVLGVPRDSAVVCNESFRVACNVPPPHDEWRFYAQPPGWARNRESGAGNRPFGRLRAGEPGVGSREPGFSRRRRRRSRGGGLVRASFERTREPGARSRRVEDLVPGSPFLVPRFAGGGSLDRQPRTGRRKELGRIQHGPAGRGGAPDKPSSGLSGSPRGLPGPRYMPTAYPTQPTGRNRSGLEPSPAPRTIPEPFASPLLTPLPATRIAS